MTRREMEDQRWYHVGRASAFEEQEKYLRKVAADMFADGKHDDWARHIRDLAVAARDRASEQRRDQKRLEDDIAKLDALKEKKK